MTDYERIQLERLWEELGSLPETIPDPGSTERIANALKLIHERENRPMKRSTLVAALIAGMVVGAAGTAAALNRNTSPAPAVVAAAPANGHGGTAPVAGSGTASGNTYLLLLHENPKQHQDVSASAMDSIIGEYRAWAERLRSGNHLVSAEKLADSGSTLGANGSKTAFSAEATTAEDMVSGYYIIRADSYDAAIALAQESPHIRYGGTIEVRPVQDTSAK